MSVLLEPGADVGVGIPAGGGDLVPPKEDVPRICHSFWTNLCYFWLSGVLVGEDGHHLPEEGVQEVIRRVLGGVQHDVAPLGIYQQLRRNLGGI